MKYITLLILLLIIPVTSAYSQQITITPFPDHAGNNQNTFPADNGTFTITGNQFTVGSAVVVNPVSWAFSNYKSKFAFLERRENVYLRSVDESGNTLIDT